MLKKIIRLFTRPSYIRAGIGNIRGGAGQLDEGQGFGTAHTNNHNET